MEPWLGVELRHLSALAAVAEERSFRGAADRLGYVQSAVSQRIAQLEIAVGARLVERSRGHRDVSLTEAGRSLLHHAEQINAQLTAARADLRAIAGEADATTLTIGSYGSLTTRVLPHAIAALEQRAPSLRVEIREASSDREHFSAVQDGTLDAAFAELPLDLGPFAWRELLIDPPMVVVSADSPLADRVEPLGLRDIAAQPVVADPTWRMFELIEREFAAAGTELDVRYTATSNAGVQALAAAGLGVAIMPRLAVDTADRATVSIDVQHLLPSRTVVCYWPQDRRHGMALRAFLDAVIRTCLPLRDRAPDRMASLVA